MSRGGKRIGSGRKKNLDPTIPIRVPLSMKDSIKKWIQDGTPDNSRPENRQESIRQSLSVLQNALLLKANAGGKIKTEIKKAMDMLQQKV